QVAKEGRWVGFGAVAAGKERSTAFSETRPRGEQTTPARRAEEERVATVEDKAKLFRKTLFPPLPEYTAPPPERNDRQPPRLWQPVSPEAVRWAIFTSSPTKAPGPDGLSFRCLRVAYEAMPHWFNDLYRKVI